MWSILPPTIRCLYHWPANEVDSAWDDQPLTYTQKAKKSLFKPPFRVLRGNVRTPSIARWKARVVDFILVIIELFSLSPTVETLWAEIGRSPRLSKGVGHFVRRFQREGGVTHQPPLVSSSRVIALPCGIKISAVRHLVLSQCTCVTDRQTDGHNYDSQDRPRICSRDKNSRGCTAVDNKIINFRTDFHTREDF